MILRERRINKKLQTARYQIYIAKERNDVGRLLLILDREISNDDESQSCPNVFKCTEIDTNKNYMYTSTTHIQMKKTN